MAIIDQEPSWQDDLLRDERGNVLCWEFNADLILRNDPLIREQVRRAGKEVERATIDALLFLQSRHRIRIDYHVLLIMVRLLSEQYSKMARRGALADDPGYFKR